MTIPYPKNGKIRGGAGVPIQKSRLLFGCVKFEMQSRYPCDDALLWVWRSVESKARAGA